MKHETVFNFVNKKTKQKIEADPFKRNSLYNFNGGKVTPIHHKKSASL